MKAFLLLLILFSFSLSSCKSTQKQDKVAQSDSVTTVIAIPEWTGVYSGSLPCNDCAGIFTRLDLKNSNQYAMEMIYLGKSPDVNYTEGNITWLKDKNILKLESSSRPVLYFSIHENSITLLNENQQPHTGSDAARYTLNRQDPIAERNWKLLWTEQSVQSPQEHFNDVNLTLSAAEKRASGKGGCNSYSGGYQTAHPNGIRFSGIMSTKMACPSLNLETDYFKALENTRTFEVHGDTLSFLNEQKQTVAKFINVITK